MTRAKLIDAFIEIRGYGVSLDTPIDLHERIVPLVDQISEMLVRAGAEHFADRIKPGEALTRHRERRIDHHAGPIPHLGRRISHRYPGVVDRIDHRVASQPHTLRLHGKLVRY